jgi:hypothetical protein
LFVTVKILQSATTNTGKVGDRACTLKSNIYIGGHALPPTDFPKVTVVAWSRLAR